jgi:predicted RNA-binding protein YlxR (DUF448 family)
MAKKKKRPRKHIPQRTCVGCRTVQEKRSLIRLVRTSVGVYVDEGNKLNGRGAYLHDRISCWQKGLAGRLARALKTELGEEDVARLKAYMESLSVEADIDEVSAVT